MAAAQDTKDNCERVRDVGERAVTAGGLHVAEGSTIWDAYRSENIFKCCARWKIFRCNLSMHCCTSAGAQGNWRHMIELARQVRADVKLVRLVTVAALQGF